MEDKRNIPDPTPYKRDVTAQKRGRREQRDPHMFTLINKDEFEFWYGIHGPNGEHRRFVVPVDVAYVFFKRHTAKLELLYEKRGVVLPAVDLDDIDDYIKDALRGLPEEPEEEEGTTFNDDTTTAT